MTIFNSITRPIIDTIFKPLTSPFGNPLAGWLAQAWADFSPETMAGTNPIWNDANGTAARDLDVQVGTAANLTILPSGVALLPGDTGDDIATPDSAAASITGSITLIAYVSVDDWVSGVIQYFMSKWDVGQTSYRLGVDPVGKLRLSISDGSTHNQVSDTSTGFAAGSGHWARASWNDSTDVVNFYTSEDLPSTDPNSVAWSLLGSADVALASTGIADTTSEVAIGAANGGTLNPLSGKVYRAVVIAGIDPTVTPNVDFDPTKATVNTPTFVSGGATWTINGDAFVNATKFQGIYSSGGAGLETTASQLIAVPTTVFSVFKPTLTSPAADQYIFDSRSLGLSSRFLLSQSGKSDRFGINQGTDIDITQAYDNNQRTFTSEFNADVTTKITISDLGSTVGDAGSEDFDFGSVFIDKTGVNGMPGLFLEHVIFLTSELPAPVATIAAALQAKYS